VVASLNEPLFTDYSLPRGHGYTGADYARWTKAFASAARRANPDCRVLAGIGYLSDGAILKDFEQFFAAGGLAAVDAVDIHHYPRLRPPEFAEKLLAQLNALMEQHGGRKPIWLTEYGYYADDDPWSVPIPHSGFDQPLEDEIVQAEYAVRWAILMLAGGVEKIFYHAGTCDGVNQDSLQGIFFEYAGQPHKIYAAQAVLAHLFPPSCAFVKRLEMGNKIRGYLFRDGERTLAAVWAKEGADAPVVPIDSQSLEVWDIMGRPLSSPILPLGPIPLYVIGDEAAIEVFARASRDEDAER